MLDKLFPDRPVYLESSFGHSAWVNSRALKLAGITKDTKAGDDDVIVRDPATGLATGALHDAAMLLVKDILPPVSMAYQLKRVRAAIDMAHSLGVTAVIEPGLDETLIAPLLKLSDAGEFKLRAVASLSPINWQPGAFDDGVIESGTGALLEP